MKVEYGRVKEYKTKKGYGFVTRTLDSTIRQDNKDVWFHISIIKYSFPDLAQQLDNGLAKDACFWYLIDTSERDKVEKIWLDINDIPDPYHRDLFLYIERLSNHLPPLLEQINNICLATKKQTLISNQLKLRETDKTKPIEIKAKKVDIHKIELEKSELEKAQTDEIIRDEKYYAGLPEDLINSVFWVGREFRRNSLSYIEGDYDLIIEYQDGQILEYDWIKSPFYYMRRTICNLLGYEAKNYIYIDNKEIMAVSKEKFRRIFAMKYKKDGSRTRFSEVWNFNESTWTPCQTLNRFETTVLLPKAEVLEKMRRHKEAKNRKRQQYTSRRYQLLNGRKSQSR